MSDGKPAVAYSDGQIISYAATSFALGFLLRYKLPSFLTLLRKNLNLSSGDMKLVLIVRSDIGMTKGKIASQCAHAAVACYKEGLESKPQLIQQWERLGQPKMVLKINGEQELVNLGHKASCENMIVAVIRDAGRTQIRPGTKTVLGIGPDFKSRIDKLTSSLKLL